MLTQPQLILKDARLDGADRGSYLIQGGGFFHVLFPFCSAATAGLPVFRGRNQQRRADCRALDGETLVCGDVRATVRAMPCPCSGAARSEPVQAAIDAQKPDLVLALGTDARARRAASRAFRRQLAQRGRDAGDTPEENSPIFSGEAEWLRARFPMRRWCVPCLPQACPPGSAR